MTASEDRNKANDHQHFGDADSLAGKPLSVPPSFGSLKTETEA